MIEWKWVMGIAILVLGAVGAAQKFRNKEIQGLKPCEELLSHQQYTPVMNGEYCVDWLLRAKDTAQAEQVLGSIVRVSEKITNELGFEYPRDLDLAHYVFLFLDDKNSMNHVAWSLVNFDEIDQNLAKRLHEDGLVMIRMDGQNDF